MIDYRIKTFLTLYRLMNYRKTAEELNMTQPGVTQHIQYLEKYYGTKLFEYDGKTLRRTENADRLEESMERIMSEERGLEQAFKNVDTFTLRVGATKTIGDFVIVPTAERFLKNPKNRLELVVANTSALLRRLSEGSLDFAIIEGNFNKRRYLSRLYRTEQFVGICSPDHPFAAKKVPLEEIFCQTLLLREEGSGTRSIFEQVLLDHNYAIDSFERVITVSSFPAIRRFVADGVGITFGYRPIAEGSLGGAGNGGCNSNPGCSKRLATFTLEGINIEREFNYVYLTANTAEEKIRRFEGKEE